MQYVVCVVQCVVKSNDYKIISSIHTKGTQSKDKIMERRQRGGGGGASSSLWVETMITGTCLYVKNHL